MTSETRRAYVKKRYYHGSGEFKKIDSSHLIEQGKKVQATALKTIKEKTEKKPEDYWSFDNSEQKLKKITEMDKKV